MNPKILLVIAQMLTKERVCIEDLRGQMGLYVPQSFEIMANTMGVPNTKLVEMMKAGEVKTQDVLVPFLINLLKHIENNDIR